ncbi:MAG: 2Fe-2S iron-sulfur cluster binding domain-containing protein [Candidatus Thiothrix singaporensis]|uniref:2Fe-2S iron-sulfur cluster binding domain-containing protein n=1 Tax=Candidatus Thiothrix singaporensis TaxID=2799669 RepID=A0A7L6AW72_9GAMM|nr:MAG: 2Fe-2S iron-sulfur cluster binding domain-containing protein [Candidatus Thiothrix singaporensis]
MQVTLQPDAVQFTVAPKQTVLQAATAATVKLRHKCKVGSCGTCRYRVLSGQVRFVQDVTYTLSADEINAGIILACQTVPVTDVVIESIAR